MALTQATIRSEILAREPEIRRAFLEFVRTVLGNAKTSDVQRLIEIGQIDSVASALGIDSTSLSNLTEAIRSAYVSGGRLTADSIPALRTPDGARVRLRFDVRNVRAETWLREHSSNLVQDIVETQRGAIRVMVEEGVRAGRNPRQIALDITGRIDSATGRRAGGIVGMTEQQARFVANAREELLSGDPKRLSKYLTRTLRDKRMDGTVRKAIASGKPIPRDKVDQMVSRYADSMLRLRGENIARTEALSAFNAAQAQTYQQAIDEGKLLEQHVTKTWRSSGRSNVRDTHAAMTGQKVLRMQPFRSPSGALLMHPGDSSLGAGAAEIVNCACIVQYRIDFLAQGEQSGR